MKISEYKSLESYNLYRIKSYAKNVFFPKSENEIVEISKKYKNIKILGNGSNIIFSKEFYDDEYAFIVFSDNYSDVEFNKNIANVQSGVLLEDLCIKSYKEGLSGLETFYDVPASIGGALIMNAGAYGDQIYDMVKSVKILDLKESKTITYDIEDIDYGYRYSMFKNMENICILSAKLNLIKKNRIEIKSKIDNIYSTRLFNLPQRPSGGSVFKRPQANVPVGVMVEELGLKGKTIGGAQISPKHAGIIVNNGNATGQDVLDLIDFIKEQILENYNIVLNQEQIVI